VSGGRHEGPEAALSEAEARELGSRARALSAQLGAWLGAPLAEHTPTDDAPAEVVEWMRRARDVMDEVSRDG
jgi:hypothetical protein